MEAIKNKKDDNEFFHWYLNWIAKIGVVIWAFFLFIQRSWVGEDAFIFFRYVDHLVQGQGLVFNIGERVEGFTAPLWVFVLAILRGLTGFELRPIAIILGLILSTIAVVIWMLHEKSTEIFFPLTLVLLITNSAFRDFATSGFETSLTYILLILSLLGIKNGWQNSRPEILGLVVSLLVLNRPEAVLILFYLVAKSLVLSYKTKNWVEFIRFLIPVVLLVGGYQIFRMGYFASLLPNTFYAKKGGSLYIAQGFNYVGDFFKSYPLTIIVYILVTVFAIATKQKKELFIIAGLLIGYVLYAGGDYMHGRSLLMAFIAWSFALIDPTKSLIINLQQKTNIKKLTLQLGSIILIIFIGLISLKQVSYTVRTKKAVNYIEDERSRFGYFIDSTQFKQYIALPITFELGWTERGLYYRELSEKLGMPISVVNANIGYFGYASGDMVNIMGGVLVDPYLARATVENRGKIGHENDPNLAYVFSRKPTFAYTPYKYWNEHAHYKLDQAYFSYAIKDDSNDSFIPIFDLSNEELLTKFSTLIGKNIKQEIDLSQIDYLNALNAKNLPQDFTEYLGFLKTYWYPYASIQHQAVFDKKTVEIGWTSGQSSYEKFWSTQNTKSTELWGHLTGELTASQFIKNMRYAFVQR